VTPQKANLLLQQFNSERLRQSRDNKILMRRKIRLFCKNTVR